MGTTCNCSYGSEFVWSVEETNGMCGDIPCKFIHHSSTITFTSDDVGWKLLQRSAKGWHTQVKERCM